MDLQVLGEMMSNHVLEVNKTFRELEDIDARIKGVAGNTTVALYTDYGTSGGTTKISDILPGALLAELETKVISAMERERYERENRLLKLIQYKPPEEKIDTSSLEKKVKEVEVKPSEKKKGKASKMTVDDVKKFLKAGKTPKDIANHYGYKTVQTVNNFIETNKLMAADKKVDIEEMLSKKIPEIKALYTNGPFNMKMLAEEFSVDVKVMHGFCEKKGLLKPSKKDPFKGK